MSKLYNLENEEYILNLPYHLTEAGMADELCEILTEFDFLQHKVLSADPQLLIEDYEMVRQPEIQIHDPKITDLRLIQDAIRLSANTLRQYPVLLVEQLTGRLLSSNSLGVQTLLNQAISSKKETWLRPLIECLSSPKSYLEYTLAGHSSIISTVAVTTDGQIAASGAWDKTIKIWDLKAGVHLQTLRGHQGYVNSVSIAPNSKILVSGSDDCTVNIWSLENGNILKTLKGHSASVNAVLMLPDKRRILSASDDTTIKVWDLDTGQELIALKGHTGSIDFLAVTPDGRITFSGGGGSRRIDYQKPDDYAIRVWDLNNGEQIGTLEGHFDRIQGISAISNEFVVSASFDRTIKIWDVANSVEISSINTNTPIHTMSVTPDGRFVVSNGGRDYLKIWDLSTGSEFATLLGHSAYVSTVVTTFDSRRIISGSADGTIKVWDLSHGSRSDNFVGHLQGIRGLIVAPDRKRAFSASYDGTVKVWNIQNGIELLTLRKSQRWPYDLHSVTVTSDCQFVIAGGVDGTLTVWNLESGERLGVLEGHSVSVRAVVTLPNSYLVMSASEDGEVRIWDLEFGECVECFYVPTEESEELELAVTMDGCIGVLAGDHFMLYAPNLDLMMMQPVKGATAMAMSKDGTRAIVAVGRIIKVFDLVQKLELQSLSGHLDRIFSVAITEDGKRAVSASYDQTLKAWDLKKGQDLATFVADGMLEACTIAPDGITVVAGESSGRIHLLQIEQLEETEERSHRSIP